MNVVLEALHTKTPEHMAVFARVYNKDPDLYELQQRFLQLYGNAYASMRPRFSQHDPDFVFADIDFIQHLGPDVAHETHPLKQIDIVRRYGLSPSLGLVALIHDWGEIAPDVGDIRHGDPKADDLNHSETDTRNEVVKSLFSKNIFGCIIQSTADALDPSTPSGEEFKLAERIGYMETILRAADLASVAERFPRLGITPKKQAVLWSIASHAHFHVKHLIPASDINPGIARLLESNDHLIDVIFDRFDGPA